MALFKQFKHIDYQWGIWKQEETLEQLLMMLPQYGVAYRKQLNAFTSESRKKEWLAVRVLLYKMMHEVKEIAYQDNGKPYLADGSAFISISHTKGYVAVILSKQKKVGIDIEVLSERAQRVCHKFVAENELCFREDNTLSKAELFTMIWSAKEVMYKCMDKANVLFLEELHVDVDIAFFCDPYLNAWETHTPAKQKFRIHYMLQENEFVLTWTHY